MSNFFSYFKYLPFLGSISSIFKEAKSKDDSRTKVTKIFTDVVVAAVPLVKANNPTMGSQVDDIAAGIVAQIGQSTGVNPGA